jgi:murein DD-endopeptidase MepM/ murein hydrolase activator NlpD
VRQVHLNSLHLALGGGVVASLIFLLVIFVSSIGADAKDILYAMEKKTVPEERFVGNSESDYEAKLMELQANIEESQRDLRQFDALRAELSRNHGVIPYNPEFTNYSIANNVIDLGNSQGGPVRPPAAVINLGNQDEQYGVRLDRALQDIIYLNSRVKEAKESLAHTWKTDNVIPTGIPLELPSQASSGLGYRLDPITKQPAWHEGTDYPAAYGTPILATADGVVVRAAEDAEYGNVIDIQHQGGVITRYAHAQELLVQKGDRIKKSQVIAKVGSTGRSTGPHVHYEVIQGGSATLARQ